MRVLKLTGRRRWDVGEVTGVDAEVDEEANARGVPMIPFRSGSTIWEELPDLLSGEANTLKSA